jgi:HSP20 family protein
MCVDVTETPEAYHIHADLPGCLREDIELMLKANVLQIRATRRRPSSAGARCVTHRAERQFSPVSRALLLPNNCLTDEVSARYENGVLVVSIAKAKGGDDHAVARGDKEAEEEEEEVVDSADVEEEEEEEARST